MTEISSETTKSRVADRLKIMVGEGLEVARRTQAARNQAEQVQFQYATGQDGLTLEDVRAAQDAYKHAAADEAAHADGVAVIEAALKELERQEREHELLTLATATRAELDRVQVTAISRLEAAEREAISAAHAYRGAKREAELLRVRLRVQIWEIARVQGRLGNEGQMTHKHRVETEEILNQPWRAGDEHNPLTMRVIVGNHSNPASDTSAHASRWRSTLEMLAAQGL